MPVATCPHCTAELDLDADDLGQLVECPACRTQFTAGDPPAPPPTKPKPADTQVVNCPGCGERVTVAAEDLGYRLRCPLCSRRFVAPVSPWASNPARHESAYWVRQDSPRALIRDAKTECTAAGVGLIIVGVMTVFVSLFQVAEAVRVLANFGDSGAFLMLGFGVYSVIAGGFWIYAGVQLKGAKQYGVCMIGCITALIPVVNPCCIFGLIYGIMGLVKLNDPRVKKGFRANRPGNDPDAPE